MSVVHPYDFGQAKAAIERAARAQKDSEQHLRDAYTKYAAAERAYRLALAEEILRLKADGVAWSSTSDLARGDKHVADLRYARDVADGVKEAAAQVAFRHAADRRELEQLVRWSMSIGLDGQYVPADLRAAA
ncbi:MAG TPA: hypothetical protein VHV75_09935 [Solirubrobacteraceae bacterium]|jgi:hypothetical protein|nr:hypothetical protein [Solirubrobacteraceae bacterium]